MQFSETFSKRMFASEKCNSPYEIVHLPPQTLIAKNKPIFTALVGSTRTVLTVYFYTSYSIRPTCMSPVQTQDAPSSILELFTQFSVFLQLMFYAVKLHPSIELDRKPADFNYPFIS